MKLSRRRRQSAIPTFLFLAAALASTSASGQGQGILVGANLPFAGIVDAPQTVTAISADNRTVTLSGVTLPTAAGGLSGAPVLEASNRVIAQLRAALGAGYPIIGVGGILSADDALSKLKAGADVVQIYTGLIYKGPKLVDDIARAFRKQRTA